jgi:hypothetical protein
MIFILLHHHDVVSVRIIIFMIIWSEFSKGYNFHCNHDEHDDHNVDFD